MTVLHFIVDFVYPSPGGMQAALLRVAKQFDATPGFRSVIYTRRQQPQYRERAPEHGEVEIVHLSSRKDLLMEPRGEDDGTADSLPSAYSVHAFQVDAMLLEQEVEARAARRASAGDRHMIVSFFAAKAGFVAQHAALNLGMRHICCFRGSDYSTHFVNPFLVGAIQFVVERADLIVTTNDRQARHLSKAFPRAKAFQTIHNSIEFPAGVADHRPPPGPPVRLVSDCEFSLKKATHLLMEAAAELDRRGLPVTLEIVGRSSNDEDDYWERRRTELAERCPGVFSFPGRLSSAEIEQRLLRSHIYGSATLSEGCSHARIRALLMGMPIVTTRCGALAEFVGDCSHVAFARPGDREAFVRELGAMVAAAADGSIEIDRGVVEAAREHFSWARERRDWETAVETVLGAE